MFIFNLDSSIYIMFHQTTKKKTKGDGVQGQGKQQQT